MRVIPVLWKPVYPLNHLKSVNEWDITYAQNDSLKYYRGTKNHQNNHQKDTSWIPDNIPEYYVAMKYDEEDL